MKFEQHYWDKRYRLGGNSGNGSVGEYRKWKWKVINSFVKNIRDKTVLDVGCGDLRFLKKQKFKDYLGLDISPTIIERNQNLRPDLKFWIKDVTCPSNIYNLRENKIRFDVVLCMDLLFHIMNDNDFKNLLRNLNRWTGEYLFLVNWSRNPLKLFQRSEYQIFRGLLSYLDWLSDLKLIETFQRPSDSHNMIYVFRRRS